MRAGTRLASIQGEPVGRLSALVFDENGRTYGLTARHVLQGNPDGLFYYRDGSLSIGSSADLARLEEQTGQGGSEPFIGAIGVFEIDPDLVGDQAELGTQNPKTTASALDCVGERLVRFGGEIVAATVLSVGGSVIVEDTDTESQHLYDDVVELRFEAASPDPLRRGEAGSLFVDGKGRAVAVLIAASSDVGYAASLESFLERHSLSLVPPMTSARAEASVEAAVRELLPNAVDAIAGARAMREDLERESPLQGDPSGDDVPAHLLELLEPAI